VSSTSGRKPSKGRFEIESDVSQEMERHTPVATESRRRRIEKQDATATDAGTNAGTVARLPWSLQPSLLVFLGSVFFAMTWIGFQNPEGGFHQGMKYWPWELFRADLAQGGAIVFAWDAYRAVALIGAVLTLLLLVLSLLRSSRARGVAVGIAAAVSLSLFWQDLPTLQLGSLWALPLSAALLAGAVLGRDGRLGREGSRWPIFALLLLVLGLLFVPTVGTATYAPGALDFAAPFQDVISGTVPLGLDRLWSTDGVHAIGLVLLLVLGILTLVGARGRWTLWTGPLLVLLTAFGPIIARWVFDAPAAPEGTLDLVHLLAGFEWTILLGAFVIVLAAVLSWSGLGGRWTVGAAGVGLGILFLIVTSRYFVAGLESSTGFTPFFAGAARAAPWLGAALGALLAPLAAAVIDQHQVPEVPDR